MTGVYFRLKSETSTVQICPRDLILFFVFPISWIANYHKEKFGASYFLPCRKYLFVAIMVDFAYPINMEELKEKTYFLAALDQFVERKGRGIQTYLAITTGLSEGHLSQVISRTKSASFNCQVKIARALGHEYTEFLEIGKKIVTAEGTLPQISEKQTSYIADAGSKIKNQIDNEHARAVALTSKVMLSRHKEIGKALMKNLEEFASAVNTRDELEKYKIQLSDQQKRIEEQDKKINDQQKEIEALNQRINSMDETIKELLKREPHCGSGTPGDGDPVPVEKAT